MSPLNENLLREDQVQRAPRAFDEGWLADEDIDESDLLSIVTNDDIKQASLSGPHHAALVSVISGLWSLEELKPGQGIAVVRKTLDLLTAHPSFFARMNIAYALLGRPAPSPAQLAHYRGVSRQSTSGDVLEAIAALKADPQFAPYAEYMEQIRSASFESTSHKKRERLQNYEKLRHAKFRVDIYTYNDKGVPIINDRDYCSSYEERLSPEDRFLEYENLLNGTKKSVRDRNCRLYRISDEKQVDGLYSKKCRKK